MPRLETWRAKAGLLAVATLLALLITALAGEVAVRYRERHRATLGGTMPLLYYRHARLGHALVRDFDYFGWVHVNREGFRGPEVAVRKPLGTVRIMAVGSSTTFDPSVSGDQATWPARLQVWINQLAPQRSVEVINAGVPGYHVIDDVMRLETELYRFRPDVVILYEGHNDLFGALRRGSEGAPPFTRTPNECPAVTPWTRWLSLHSLLYGKVVARLQSLQFLAAGQLALALTGPTTSSAEGVIDSGAVAFERDLIVFVSVARSLGIRVVIPQLVHVSRSGAREEPDSTLRHVWAYTVPFAQPETVLQGYLRYNAVLRRVAASLGATWLATDSFGLVGPGWYDVGDPIHFNDRGADRMARRLAEALVIARVLDPPRTDGSVDRAGSR
jgi:lysophospholipase L1-like esterase